MKKLIDRDEIISFPREEYSGYANFVWDLIDKYGLNDRENDAMEFAEEILEGFMNVVESAEVVEEREETRCYRHWTMPRNYPIYHYSCGKCGESINSNSENEEYKFCPYCGAKYVEIVRD